MSQYDEMTRAWLMEHVRLLYPDPISRVAVLAVSPSGDRKQFIVNAGNLEDKLPYLRKLNSMGYNIYCSVNVLRDGARSRKNEDFLEEQRAVYLDLDSKTKPARELWRELWEEIQAGRLPEPSWVLKSSRGNYQVYWIFDTPIPCERLERVMKELNERFGLDHTHDVARVFRLPGFRNKKKGKENDLVMPPAGDVIWIDKGKGLKVQVTRRRYSTEVFESMLRTWVRTSVEDRVTRRRRKPPGRETIIGPDQVSPGALDGRLDRLYRRFVERGRYRSRSEADAAFTAAALRKGVTEQELVGFLERARADKRNPVDYAKRTVFNVRKWLCEKGWTPRGS